jgi:hypothetical protein
MKFVAERRLGPQGRQRQGCRCCVRMSLPPLPNPPASEPEPKLSPTGGGAIPLHRANRNRWRRRELAADGAHWLGCGLYLLLCDDGVIQTSIGGKQLFCGFGVSVEGRDEAVETWA